MSQEHPSSSRFKVKEADIFPPITTEAWRQKIEADLKGATYEQHLVWHPLEGFPVQPYYRAEDLDALIQERGGTLSLGQRANKAWSICHNIPLGDLDKANQQARSALRQGADALRFMVDPQGTLNRQLDLAHLLDGISLKDVTLHWVTPEAVRPTLALLFHEAIRRGQSPSDLQGSVSNDAIGALVRRGTLDLNQAFDEISLLIRDVNQVGAQLQTLCVDGQPFHEAGATAVQELACMLGSASEYVTQLLDRGVSLLDVVRHLRFVVPVGTSYFMEIAKLRALRPLYSLVIQAYGGERMAPTHIDAVTSHWTHARYDAHTNLLRTTTEASAAIIGGCDSLTVGPYDSSDQAFRLACNIQLILKHEAHLDRVVDPAAGSYYLESLTDQLAHEAWSLFQNIEAQGGLLHALEEGFIQKAIKEKRDQRSTDLATRKRAFVGTNTFPRLDETLTDRNTSDEDKLNPPQPVDTTKSLSNKGSTITPLPKTRGSEPFETLRLRTEHYVHRTGHRPTVFLLPIGTPTLANARATFSRNTLGCAGFKIIENAPFETIEEALLSALEANANMIVLCSSDDEYDSYIPRVAEALRASHPRPLLIVASQPTEAEPSLHTTGVDYYIHRKQNLLDVLKHFQQRLGVYVEAAIDEA